LSVSSVSSVLAQKPKGLCQRWAWTGSGSEPNFDLFWSGRIRLGFSAGSDPDVISRVCQLKYAMSYVRTPLSIKSKRRIIIHSKEWFPTIPKTLQLVICDDTVVVFFTLQTIEKAKCAQRKWISTLVS